MKDGMIKEIRDNKSDREYEWKEQLSSSMILPKVKKDLFVQMEIIDAIGSIYDYQWIGHLKSVEQTII